MELQTTTLSVLKVTHSIFYTLAPGVATASFGIDVAKLAHLPKSIIERARALLTHSMICQSYLE